MRQYLLLVLINFPVLIGNAQDNYWQQQVNYDVNVELNDVNHTLKGNISIDYTNNSPDTLTYIWFHLWPNAYKDKETAYAKQILDDAEGRKRWKDMKDKGSIEEIDFTVDGKKAQHQADPENIDIVKLMLPSALLPGKKINITTPFLVKIPTYSSRSGHLGNSYMICQWYPKPAVYDRKGWHPMPYLDQGEFYSEFGNFDVQISLPQQYVVGATGSLQNADELSIYKQLGKENQLGARKKYTASKNPGLKTLRYTGENIHDFAWFADKDFIIRYDTAQLVSGNVIDVFTYSYEKGNRNWVKSISYVEDAIRSYSKWVGEYPYPVAQAVEGPLNAMSGGMEYPMITLITSPTADEPALDGVIAHEVGHNWFYGILASNERTYPWMDEGINTYYQFRYEATKHRANSIFGNEIPTELRSKPVDEFLSAIYVAISQIPIEDPIATSSEEFKDENSYAMTAYIKTALWMYIIEATVGKENLEKVMQSYFTKWKFKHPYPEDLKAEFETVLNLGFDDIFNMLNKKGGFE
jgi:hypothetical protein